jgi:hypothetical protein
MKDWRNTPGSAEVLPYLDKVCQAPPSSTPAVVGLGCEDDADETSIVLPSLRDRSAQSWGGEEDGGYRSWGGGVAMRRDLRA